MAMPLLYPLVRRCSRLRSLRCPLVTRNRFRAWQAFFDPGADSPCLDLKYPADGPDAVAPGIQATAMFFTRSGWCGCFASRVKW